VLSVDGFEIMYVERALVGGCRHPCCWQAGRLAALREAFAQPA